jgi:FlaG/FlaF family flagellin (archaellin)
MELRERWNELDTGMKVLVGLGVGGAVLLITIPVVLILAAVVGSFVLGVGDPEAGAPETPQVAMSFDYDDSAVTVIHDGGDTLDASKVVLEVGGRSTGWETTDGEISAGDSTTVTIDSGQRLTVVWRGEEEATLAVYEAP